MIDQDDENYGRLYGQAAALFDRFRPGYPKDLVERVVAGSGDRPVLEIGAGTGKVTRGLLALGRQVDAVEPDARMAAVLDLNVGSDAAVDIIVAPLEEADLRPGAYDLAVAGQSWHLVDRSVGYDVVARALAPDGRLGLLWHRPLPGQGLFGEALTQLYGRLAPGLARPLPGAGVVPFDPTTEPEAATRLFTDWTRAEHHWKREVDAATLVGWLCSSARHRMLPLDTRSEVLTAVAALLEEFGGRVQIEMATVAHLATLA